MSLGDHKSPLAASESRRAALRWLAVCTVVTAIVALLSNGAYHDDDLKHFLFARWVRHDPAYLTDAWGRPGFTVLYAVPAQAGWWACRLLSAALSAATAWATFRSAEKLGFRHAAWAVPLVFIQPLFLHLSSTTLTETPAAFYLATATWALLAGRPALSAGLFSPVLVTRHEAIVLLPVWAWAQWRWVRFGAVPVRPGAGALACASGPLGRSWPVASWALLLWAPVVQNLAAWVAFGQWPGEALLRTTRATQYGHGTPFTFLMRLVVAAGPVVATLAIVGLGRLWRDRRARPIVVGIVVFLVAQTALYMHQLYATGGYARFLVPLAPWLAIAALAGADTARERATPWVAGAAVTLWLAAEIEQAINPIAAIAPYWWLFRLAAAVFCGGMLVPFSIGRCRRGAGSPSASDGRPEAGTTGRETVPLETDSASVMPRFGRRVCAVVAAVAILGPAARAAWPHRLRPRERAIAEAIRAVGREPLDLVTSCPPTDWSY